MKSESKSYVRIRHAGIGLRQRLAVTIQGLIHGPTHHGGVLPPGALEPGIARIEASRNSQHESLAASWRYQQFSIPAAIEQTRIDLETAQVDLERCEEVLEAHRAEYRRTHRGLDAPAAGNRLRSVGFWVLAGIFTLFEMPLTAAAFERLLATDWERLIATVGASAVTVGLSYEIGAWFARPAKTIGQRLFGWLLVMTLAMILAALSIVRTQAIEKHLKDPARSTPEVRLEFPKKGRPFHA